MTQEDFDRILEQILRETPPGELLTIPGAYEVFSEYFNNEILDRWAHDQD